MTAVLPPVRQPIGVFGNYFAQPGFTTLVLKEKVMSLSGDSFDIRMRETGQPIITVQGKMIGSKKTATDSETNQHLWTLGREYMHLHTTYTIKDSNGAVVMEVRSGLFTSELCPFSLSLLSCRLLLPFS